MGDRDGDYCEQKEEVRQNARRVVAGALLSPSATSTGMAPHVLEGTAWLIELAATEAHTLTTTPDPLGQLSTPPSPPPSNDTLPWTRLEAALHILGAIATGLSTTQEPSAKQLMRANTTKTLISTLPILPARRALWREAAITSSELGLSLDLSNQEASSLLLACCTAAARTLQVEEFGNALHVLPGIAFVAEERAVSEHLLVRVLVTLSALDHAVEAEHAAVIRRIEDQNVLASPLQASSL